MLLPFFKLMEAWTHDASTTWAVVHIVHLCAMVTFLGALMIVDLRCGRGLTHQPVSVFATEARPWLIARWFAVPHGFPQMATATAQYRNQSSGPDVSARAGHLFTLPCAQPLAFVEARALGHGHACGCPRCDRGVARWRRLIR